MGDEVRTDASMLVGERVGLRPVREADLDRLYDAHIAIGTRGHYFPLGVMSDGEVAGHIEFFRPVSYWDAFELSYQLYDDRHAGRGYMTEAVQLLVVDYLLGTKKEHRIHLVIVPGNAASRRIAEKCGFELEGTVRGAFFTDGRNHDVLLYGLLRTDPRPWHPEAPAADG